MYNNGLSNPILSISTERKELSQAQPKIRLETKLTNNRAGFWMSQKVDYFTKTLFGSGKQRLRALFIHILTCQ